eukprot:TRINITY_DN6822_c0_g1_i11.p2 TRINITY_DN6822_c0_g1~~TRINITY_DN6822_c0_g1_i11.p2  ORF type:complete len:139 (-),score=0.71 TRINITY_DN6822_c0_g1_i11:440-856(-)
MFFLSYLEVKTNNNFQQQKSYIGLYPTSLCNFLYYTNEFSQNNIQLQKKMQRKRINTKFLNKNDKIDNLQTRGQKCGLYNLSTSSVQSTQYRNLFLIGCKFVYLVVNVKMLGKSFQSVQTQKRVGKLTMRFYLSQATV